MNNLLSFSLGWTITAFLWIIFFYILGDKHSMKLFIILAVIGIIGIVISKIL